MALIRLQEKVPLPYIDESRDFQLFCRLYDVILNGVKYDIDGILKLVNTKDCKSAILQLLQTKLGFFTAKNFTDETLRYILQCFILLVKKKGTLISIKEAVYLFLKINGLETRVKVDVINDKPSENDKRLYGQVLTDHTIVIGIESQPRDVTPLYEVLRYIIPFGYNLLFYFFVGEENRNQIIVENKAKIMYISNDINTAVTGSKRPIIIDYSDPAAEKQNAFELKHPGLWDDSKNKQWYKDTKIIIEEEGETKEVSISNTIQRNVNSINSLEIIPQGNAGQEKPGEVGKEGSNNENVLEIFDIGDSTNE